MKLLKCHVENFGKLSNFDYEFEDGLNTIKEDNGFGKTTFAGFIKAMFYGLDAKKNTKVLIDRKKYEPWQGGAFGGYIEFELKNKKYKIERFFGKKESDDTFKLYDLETNLESNDYKSNIGEEIFKLNKEAYERSSFISGQNMETSMNDSINAKLGNILESENDINTSEQALKNLDEAIKNYKKTGGRGALNEKILERTKLEKKLEQSKIDEKNLQSRKDKNAKLREIIKQKEKELADQKNLITLHMKNEARKAKIENYKMLEKNANENKAILEEYENFFKNGIPEDEDIETLIEKCILLEKCKTEIRNYDISPEDKSEIENLKSLFQGQHISEDIINNKISAYNKLNDIKNEIKINEEKITNLNKEKTSLNKQKNNSRIIGLIICLISVILVAVGIGAYFKDLKNIALYILIGGAVFFIIFIIETILSNKKNKQIEDKEEKLNEASKLTKRLEKDVLHIQNDLTDFTDQYSDKEICLDMILELTEIKSKYMKYKDLKNNIDSIFEKQNEVVRKFDELEESVKDYLLGYFEEIDDTYVNYAQEIKMKKNELKKQREYYNQRLKEQDDYRKENNIEDNELNEVNEKDELKKEKIDEKISELNEEISKLTEEKSYNQNQIELLESNLETVFDIENEIEELNQKIEEMQVNCNILEKTKKYLETAKNQFSSRYLGEMIESFNNNLKLISGQNMNTNLDVKLNVKINEQGSNKDLKYFSTGYKDLIYICMRLSLIDSLFKEEKPFIILDDPFVNLDKTKTKKAIDLLKDIAKRYQIIYFICHESRK